jgi:hypothetical protein
MLSEYEKLQHRHLSLLHKMQLAGIEAACNSNGEWTVNIDPPVWRGRIFAVPPGKMACPAVVSCDALTAQVEIDGVSVDFVRISP